MEIFIVALLIFAQLYFFTATRKKIGKLSKLIPDASNFSLHPLYIQEELLGVLSAANLNKHLAGEQNMVIYLPNEDEEYVEPESVQVSFVKTQASNEDFASLQDTLNLYLLRNGGGIPEFARMKEMIDRKVELEEESISLSLPIPLYIGLAGTMLGIVLGLLNMPSLQISTGNTSELAQGIDGLLAGVRWAMVVSVLGLMMTAFNSAHIFKQGMNELNRKRSDFYDFLQIELLPTMGRDIASVVNQLQLHLSEFNEGFGDHMDTMRDVFSKNEDSIRAQQEMVRALATLDFRKMNDTFKALAISVERLDSFNAYLTQTSQWMVQTDQINGRFINLLDALRDVQGLAQEVKGTVAGGNQVMSYMTAHLDVLKNKDAAVNTMLTKMDAQLATANNSLTQVTNELLIHGDNTVEGVKKVLSASIEKLNSNLIEGLNTLVITLENNPVDLGKLKELDHLKGILQELKQRPVGGGGRLPAEQRPVDQTNEAMLRALQKLNGKLDVLVTESQRTVWQKAAYALGIKKHG